MSAYPEQFLADLDQEIDDLERAFRSSSPRDRAVAVDWRDLLLGDVDRMIEVVEDRNLAIEDRLREIADRVS